MERKASIWKGKNGKPAQAGVFLPGFGYLKLLPLLTTFPTVAKRVSIRLS